MLSKLLLGLTLFAATTSVAFAQCSCSHCSGGAVHGAYQNVTGHCGCGPGQSCADCGTQTGILGRPALQNKCACVGKCRCGTPVYGPCGDAWPDRPVPSPPECGTRSDWNHPYFDCCKPCVFDYPYCDPCCRKPYVSVFGGYTRLQNIDVVSEITLPTVTTVRNAGTPPPDPNPDELPGYTDFLADSIDTEIVREQGVITDDGIGFGGALGYRVHPMIRLEAEASYRENDVTGWFLAETTTVTTTIFTNPDGGVPDFSNFNVLNPVVTTTRSVEDATGTIRSYSALFNAVADFSLPRVKCANVFLGGGLGLSYVDGDILTATNEYRIDSTSFAYQLIAGGNVRLTRHLEAFGEYRYLGADNISIDDTNTNLSLEGKSDGIDTHNAFFGVRLYPHR